MGNQQPSLLEQISPLPIGFGGAAISGEGGGYGFGKISHDAAIELLQEVKARGVTIFDTAPIYGYGESEKRIGAAFASCRDEVFIVSKCGVTWHENKRINLTNDPKVAASMLDESRKRLQCDTIDLYMIHWPDKRIDIRRPMEVLASAQAKGQIKHIGLSNTNAQDLTHALEIAPVATIQQEHNILTPPSEEALIKLVEQEQISVMGYGTYDKGILTGRVQKERKYDQSDLRSWAPWWKQSNPDQRVEKATRLHSIIKQHGITPQEFLLAHGRLIRGVDIALCGVRNLEQLDSTLNALNSLPPLSVIEAIVSEYEQAGHC